MQSITSRGHAILGTYLGTERKSKRLPFGSIGRAMYVRRRVDANLMLQTLAQLRRQTAMVDRLRRSARGVVCLSIACGARVRAGAREAGNSKLQHRHAGGWIEGGDGISHRKSRDASAKFLFCQHEAPSPNIVVISSRSMNLSKLYSL